MSVLLTNGFKEYSYDYRHKDISNTFVGLNRFLSNICITQVNLSEIRVFVKKSNHKENRGSIPQPSLSISEVSLAFSKNRRGGE